MRIAVGTRHVRLISREHRSAPMSPTYGLVVFLLCVLAMPVVAVWMGIDYGLATGLGGALSLGLLGLVIGIKAAGNKN